MPKLKAKNGRSTAKLSSWPWLGLYVTPRNARADGTWRILFEVPRRLRPSGWPPTIALPREGASCKGPDDLEAIIRIRAEARELHEALKIGRGIAPKVIEHARKGSIPWLVEKYGGARLLAAVRGDLATMDVALDPREGSEEWREIQPGTRASYIRLLRHVFAWSLTNAHKHVRGIEAREAKAFLDLYNDRRKQRAELRAMLARLFAIARTEGELFGDPLKDLRAPNRRRVKGGRRRQAVAALWTLANVEAHARIAREVKAWCEGRGGRRTAWAGGSIMVRLMWETAADSTDVIAWRKGKGGEFVDDPALPGINFDRGKTGVPAFLPISLELAAEIRANGSLYVVTDPTGRPYDGFRDDARLRRHMKTLRAYAMKAGEPALVFDHLRHSAATHANLCGVDPGDVRHLTAHKSGAMARDIYIQQSREKTIEIQRARGIIR